MTKTEVLKALSKHKRGQLISIKYKTECPVTAKSRDDGYEVYKISQGVVRYGCKHCNLKTVKERMALLTEDQIAEQKEKQKTLTWKWDPNNQYIIKQHIEKGTEYLNVQTMPGKYNSSQYIVKKGNDETYMSKEMIMSLQLLQQSYFNKKELDTYDITLSNIIEIK